MLVNFRVYNLDYNLGSIIPAFKGKETICFSWWAGLKMAVNSLIIFLFPLPLNLPWPAITLAKRRQHEWRDPSTRLKLEENLKFLPGACMSFLRSWITLLKRPHGEALKTTWTKRGAQWSPASSCPHQCARHMNEAILEPHTSLIASWVAPGPQ